MRTLPITLKDFTGEFGLVEWGPTFAAIVMAVMPTLILYFILSKNVIEGIAGELVYKRHKRAADLEKPLSCADINKLTGTYSIATREIGNEDKRRHTSTHRELIQLPNGAFVIDTPGMRELGIWDSGDGIDAAFVDIEESSRACRYADCTRTTEPGCAVLQALADGTLDAARLASYRKLKTENDYAADNNRYLETKRTKFKGIAKINKSNRKR